MTDLTRHLATAPVAFLEGALDNPAFGAPAAARLLRNPRATPAILQRIARTRYGAEPRVRKALVRHPRISPGLATRLLTELPWRDLAETSAAPHATASVRQRAESLLRERLEELALGQRIALARIAGHGVIPGLVDRGEAAVLCALLDNPRLREADALRLAGSDTAPRVLARLAEHPRFASHAAIRFAVACNPRTPSRTALGVVARLDDANRRRLEERSDAPRLVRVAASRSRSEGEPARRSHLGSR